ERRVERVDVLRQPDGAAGDAGGQRPRVADDQDVAIRVGGDRGQRQVVREVVADVEIGEQELVGERLFDLGELLPVAQADRRTGRRVRVGEDVEHVLAVP